VSARTAIAAAAAGLLLATALATRAAAPAPAGSITFVDGEATRLPAGAKAKEKLTSGSRVFQGDVIETVSRTRLELTLVDQSVLRLGPHSRVDLDAAAFGKDPLDRKVSAKLRVGNVWAHVTRTLGGEARFEVKTENAVAGVRGTTFRVDAATDKSCVVKVYSGTVAVAAGPLPRPAHGEAAPGGKPARTQVAGPSEVTREQWERIVTSMMQVKVAADGRAGEAEEFAMVESDEWEKWNRERDARGK
jgi:hypothetical protein